MATYSYLRVSSTHQDELNQKQGVDKKAKELGLNIDKYITDKVSGIKDPSERNLGKLLRLLKRDDVLIVSEISRLSRSIFATFRIFEQLLNKGVKLYSVKENFVLNDSVQSKVMIFAFGLAANIERDMISQRTKEALALRKAQGVRLGRPPFSKSKTNKLDPYKNKIIIWLKKGFSKACIARKVHCVDKTLRKYIVANNLASQNS